MRALFVWRWGFRLALGSVVLSLLGPRDRPLFSERNGYRRPVFKIRRWRLFVNRLPSIALDNPTDRPATISLELDHTDGTTNCTTKERP